MNPSSRAALEAYREQLELDCGDALLDEHRNDEDAAAMLIADLEDAFPGVIEKSEEWAP